MTQKFFITLLFCSAFTATVAASNSPFAPTANLPTAFEGRFRSLDSAAKLWLYDLYHKQQISTSDLPAFNTSNPSTLELLWKFHFLGHQPFDNSPFFWIQYADIKKLLNFPLTQDRFTYNALTNALDGKTTNAKEMAQLLNSMHAYAKSLGSQEESNEFIHAFQQLSKRGVSTKEISIHLDNRFPLLSRLQNSGTTLKLLPSRQSQGEWLSLHAFNIKVFDPQRNQLVLADNFTTFSDEDFFSLQNAYLNLEQIALKYFTFTHPDEFIDILQPAINHFVSIYDAAYLPLAGMPYKKAAGKQLLYPTQTQLRVETLYYQLPLIEWTIAAYFCASLLFLAAYALKKKSLDRWALALLILGFMLHSTVLTLRCYVLQRPPVSNMFETVIYVPWIAIAIGLTFYATCRTRVILSAATLTSLALLILLKLTHIDARLENVQAVLDSQYWLIVHVLMVVGSYGAFTISGILGHWYIMARWRSQATTMSTQNIAQGILHTMYVGVALLIPGTILGGVWAAESWGRFWDWDPKESWAFISACIYLLIIHAYTFKRIRDFGLAVGAVVGLMAISFTWYGVNYVLGTGLHSYGFGAGGESYYFVYLAAESLFIFLGAFFTKSSEKQLE